MIQYKIKLTRDDDRKPGSLFPVLLASYTTNTPKRGNETGVLPIAGMLAILANIILDVYDPFRKYIEIPIYISRR